jgi:hypothetical protein
MNTPVDRLLAAFEGASWESFDAFAPEAVVDWTVPGWRETSRGSEDAIDLFRGWFRDEGRFEDLRRTPLPSGELVEFTLSWLEHGVPHATHQAHVVEVEGDHIVRDTMWCGGRWPASLLAEMEEAARA